MTVCPRCHLEIPAAVDDCDCTPERPRDPEPEPPPPVPVYSENLRVERDRAFTRHADERHTIR
ncbi:DNA binding protein [Gordonia phage William]|uniref:Uncharacterized protein n=1 Tax=Gordonia phage William TaxID=2571253 RepID=A0A4Y6EEP7_9CAUD|nr:DNA binding protein [Gordonia phage William]QDF17173.1 hypothetical protein SEA_WILLIAM_78 [Gordonia phage William]